MTIKVYFIVCISEMTFLETSALTGENVEEVFLKTARSILAKIEAGKHTLGAQVMDMFFIAGELDPERMGSGIQFGDRSLRKHTSERRSQKQSDCSC